MNTPSKTTPNQSPFARLVALRYLWSRRGEAFITIISIVSVLGVALGVMVLTMVMSVMTGFEGTLKEKIVGANSHITVRAANGRIFDWPQFKGQISLVPGVESVSAYTYSQALVRNGPSASGVLVRGIEPQSAAAAQLERYLRPGLSVEQALDRQSLSADDGGGDLPPLVIGRELSRSMGLFNGSAVSLLSPTVSSTPFGLLPRFRRFAISGIYSSGLVEYEGGLAYTDLKSAQQFFDLGDTVHGFEVRVSDIDHAKEIGNRIATALGGSSSGFVVQDWTQSNAALWEALRLEKRVYFIVLLLIILMASFSIVTTLVMIVLEKRRDIAVLRTLGATSSTIKGIFRLQGTIIGGAGVLLGLVMGFLGCIALREYGFPLNEKVFQMSTVPVQIEPLNFLLVGISAFVICSLATAYPAWRAAQLQPSELLRHE